MELVNKNQSQPDDEIGAQPAPAQLAKTRKAFSRLERELSKEELVTPGVGKMLLETLESVEAENAELKSIRDRFHIIDKELAVTKEKLKSRLSIDILSTGCIAIGTGALGFVPDAWKNYPDGEVVLGIGIAMILIGIFVKAIRI